MQTTDVRRSGIATLLDIAIAPKAALCNLRQSPTWVWAFLIATALGIIAAIAVTPVTVHVMGVELPARLAADPQLAKLPAAQRSAQIGQIVGIAQTAVRFSFVAVPFAFAIGCALQALVMLVANAIGKGDGTFAKFWALAVNAGIVGTGLASVALMIIVLIRGDAGFASTRDIPGALPGLGMLVPPSAKAAFAFASVFNVFALWNAVVLVAGMTIVARIARGVAIGAVLVMLAGSGIVPLAGAVFQK